MEIIKSQYIRNGAYHGFNKLFVELHDSLSFSESQIILFEWQQNKEEEEAGHFYGFRPTITITRLELYKAAKRIMLGLIKKYDYEGCHTMDLNPIEVISYLESLGAVHGTYDSGISRYSPYKAMEDPLFCAYVNGERYFTFRANNMREANLYAFKRLSSNYTISQQATVEVKQEGPGNKIQVLPIDYNLLKKKIESQ